MKQKDIAMFAVIAIVSAVISVLLSGILITPKKDKIQKAEVVEPISAKFETPSKSDQFFNKNSINPTKLIEIGDNSNPNLFNGSTN